MIKYWVPQNIAKALLKENEHNRWTDLPLYEDPILRDRQDEEIVQTARRIKSISHHILDTESSSDTVYSSCAQYVNIVRTEYVSRLTHWQEMTVLSSDAMETHHGKQGGDTSSYAVWSGNNHTNTNI